MKLNLTYAKNAKWANKEHTLIDVVARFEEINEDLPFTADPNDPEEHGRDIYARALSGDYGVIAEYIPPPIRIPTADNNKTTAINLLQQTDWATIADVADPKISNPYLKNQQAFYDFRNIVRPIAINPVAGNIDFPTMPTATWSS